TVMRFSGFDHGGPLGWNNGGIIPHGKGIGKLTPHIRGDRWIKASDRRTLSRGRFPKWRIAKFPRQIALFLQSDSAYRAGSGFSQGAVMAVSADALVVETTRLTKIYQNRQIAINDVSLTIEPGCVLGLLGPNGAGKTTLLRLILGLHRPTAGTVRVFGRRMSTNSAGLRCRIGYIPTNPQFPRGMTPISYLDYMGRLFGLPRDVRQPRLASLIRAVDLLNASGDSIDRFSNGMTARLA